MPTGPPDRLLPDTVLTVITGSVLVVLGAILGAGGVWLAILGGSWAYIGFGVGLVITGVLLARQRRVGLAVYAAMLVVTLIWALWDVGFDRWALIPRGAFFAVVGLWLLTPWICRSLHGVDDAADRGVRSSWRGSRGWLGGAIVLVIMTTVAAIFHDPLGPNDPHETTFEVTPLNIGDTLYLCSVHEHVIALDAATGMECWRFQGVHIDLWDRDMPAQPTLIDLAIASARAPALIAPTKQRDVYVLDRRTGKPNFPVRPV